MKVKLVTFFLICFQVANLQENPLTNILESKSNCFRVIYFNFHVITNKLFSSLQLSKAFTQSDHVATMLATHFNFKKMADKNCRIYAEIRNISDANFCESNNSNLQETILNAVKEEIDKIKTVIGTFKPEVDDDETELSNPNQEGFNKRPKNNETTIDSLIDSIVEEAKRSKEVEYSISKPNTPRELKTWNPLVEGPELKIGNGTRRIYKGKKDKIKGYPFLVSLHMMSEFLCAGSIISVDMVITAASCLQVAYESKLYRGNPRTFFVRVGSDYTKDSGELVPVTEIIFHPQYDSTTLKHNLAIVKIFKKLKNASRSIKKIRFDNSSLPLDGDVKDVTVLGWGAKDEKSKLNNLENVAIANMDIYNFKDCTEVYSKYYVAESNFCAGYVNKGGGACMGDIGGPAVVSGELVGVISFGPAVCGLPNAPTVFTKVGFYAPWIREVINQNAALRRHQLSNPTSTDRSDLFIFPVYTTKPQQKRYVKSKATEFPKEIYRLKKLFHKLILSNHSVVDYITNKAKKGNNESLSEETKEILSNDDKSINFTDTPSKTGKPKAALIAGSDTSTSSESVSHILKGKHIPVKDHSGIKLDQILDTKASTQNTLPINVEYSDVLESDYGIDLTNSDKSSSSYEGIPIEVTEFGHPPPSH